MIVQCTKCNCNTDLTELNVNVGHVFDCDDCGEPLRAIQQGATIVGIPVAEIPRIKLPEILQSDPNARRLWTEDQKLRTQKKDNA